VRLRHSDELWNDFGHLVPGVLYAEGITPAADVGDRVAAYADVARTRLAGRTESDLPEIQAWRRAFSAMGLKPTQYRCASESLLRRFRKEGALPSIHPLIDLCNAVSLAYAVPVAVFDAARLTDSLEVRYATGTEPYQTFSGAVEHPEPGEVIFADAAGHAHARRWTNRQSGASAVRDTTSTTLIVAEALHATASEDIARLVAALADELTTVWSVHPKATVLTRSAPEFVA
jgi:DNA/RNA-binding domain of Phe-tRNA-synthetase-like protein